MAKLSEKFKLGGGESTAPVSVNQSNKLSDRFTLDTVNTNAFRQPATRTEIPTVEQPKKENAFVNFFKTLGNVIRGTNPTAPSNISSGASQAVAQDIALNSNKLPELGPLNNNESVINAYESLPNQNAFKRFVSQESRDIYNRKQELNPLYEQAKDAETKQKLNALGISDGDVMAAAMIEGGFATEMTKLLKEKGVTDKAEIKAIIKAAEPMVAREFNALTEKQLTQFADKHKVLGTAASFPLKVGSDIAGLVQNAANYISGKPLSNSTGGNWGTQLVQGMRNEVSDEMNPVGKFAYGVGTSIGDMAPIIALGGGAGLAYAGAAAAQGSIPELIDRGLTPDQIVFTAMANGAAEAALEKLPLGNLEKMAQQPIEKSFKSIAKVIGSQMANEGIEESGTDIANTIFDALINGDKAELNQSIQEKGFWPAVWDYVKQVGYDGLAGAVSGGLMGGGAAGVNVARNGFYNSDSKIPEIEQTETEQAEIPTVNESQAQSNVEPNTSESLTEKADDILDQATVDDGVLVDGVHTAKQLQTIAEYSNATDSRVLTWLNRTENGLKAMKYMPVATENDVVADIVQQNLNIDIHGNTVGYSRNNSRTHIGNEHQDGGEKSQISNEDLAKAGYVLSNPDELAFPKKDKYTTATHLADDSLAPKIVVRKRIDGNYYVVEAVTDANTKQDVIVTVFIEEVGKESQEYKDMFADAYRVANAPAKASPSPHVRNAHENSVDRLSTLNINQVDNSVKSDANNAQNAPDFAGIYGWSNSANQIIPQDSYARNAEFLNLENQRSDLRRQIEKLEQQNRDLRNQLKSESSDKPREQWDVQDEITALIGDKPQAYTPRGNEIRAQIAANDDILKEIKAQEESANQDVHYRMANERLSQLDNYEAGDITPATRQEYEGFTTKSGSSDYNDYVRDGKAIIAEMSPEEYIKRCAYQIFGDDGYATLESTLNTRTQKKVDGLVEKIRNGVKLDAPHLNFDTRNQEGLHRALAAYELGIDKIPVIVKGTPLDNDALGFDARNLISEIDSERADRNLDALMDELDSDDLLLEDEIQTLEAPEPQEIQTLEKPKRNKVMYEDIGLNPRTVEDYGDDDEISMEIPMEGGVPTITDENGTTSQVATNSYYKYFQYDKEGLDHLIANIEDGRYQKQVKSMQKTYENSIDQIAKYGADAKYDDLMQKGIETDDDLALAHNLLTYYYKEGDMEKVDMLLLKTQQSGTEIGRALHFFKIFGDSPLGVQQAAAKLSGSIAKQFVNEAEKNPRGKKAKQVEKVKEVTNDIVEKVREVKERKKKSSQLAKALRYNVEQKMKQEIRKGSTPKTFDMILEEVSNTLEDEYASVKFSDDAKRFFATMIQDGVKVEIIADEIDHYMKHGSFYPLEQEKSVPKPTSKKLDSILAQMGNDTVVEKDAVQTFEQIREEVKNSLEREMASIDFTDAEISYLARMIEYGATNEEITNAIVQKLTTDYMTMSAEDIEKITQLYDQADHVNSKESVELKKQAAAIGAKYLGDASFMDKWNAWRYMAMLGNPKTILRNIFGNSLFGAVTDVKDAVGALIESKMVKKGERTKAILNPKTDKALIDACARDFDEVAYEEATKGGHKYNMQSAIESERQIFKSKLLEKGRNFTNDTLENSDIKALRRKYKKALAGYLKANGYDASILKTESAEATKAREYAIKQAKEATFHEDNALAEVLSKASHNLRERGDAIGKVGEVAIESLAPFKKTPANILKEGIEYSPAGLIKFFNQVRTKADLNACIDTLSKSLTGTTILAIGAWLASKGLLVGKRGDDEDPFQKGSDYALKIGDHTFTIDWMAPAALPLFVGAELYKVFNPNESADEAKNFFETFVSLADPVLEMSMLQGLNNMLNALANSKKNSLGSTVTNIASGYVSQSIPTLAGQVARTIDPYRRTTRTNTSSYTNPAIAIAEKAGLKAVNKIPFLSMANEKYVNAWGEPQENNGGNILGRALQNFVLPGYWNDTSLTPREEKLAKLEKTYTGNGSLIPSLAENNRPTGGRLTNKEYTKWAQTRGSEMKSAVDAALAYSGKLTEKDLQAYIHDIENFANNIAKQKQFGTQMPTTYKKAYEAYINGGRSYKAVMEYYISKKK